MNQSQALAKLRKVVGPKIGYRVDAKALDAQGRAEASAKAASLLAKKQEVEAAMKARRVELLLDPTYQALKAEFVLLAEEHTRTEAVAHRKRITVGAVNDLFFSVKAEGDNWDEVVAKVAGDPK